MKPHLLNYELSKQVCEENRSVIEPNLCYNNVFQLKELAESKKWTIGYGYFGRSRYCYIRHCFFIEESGDIIDPTIFLSFPKLNRNHWVMVYRPFASLDVDDYLDLILENDLRPDLHVALRDEEAEAYQWFMETQEPLEIRSYPYLSHWDEDRKLHIVDYTKGKDLTQRV